jgi:hypothetical protein
MADEEPELPLPEPPIPRSVRWRKRALSVLAEPIRLLTEPIKLPGWAAAVLAIVIFLPDWHARIEFWLNVVKGIGGYSGMLAAVLASPYFSPALFVSGIVWVLLVGEPKKGVQRRHWLRYIGWSIFAICLTAVILTAGYGAIEFYIQEQISSRDRDLQARGAQRPIFWHLTDAEKTALAIELDKIPEIDRFTIQIKCLPDAGSRTFVEDIGKIFTDHKWQIAANCLFSNVRPDLVGLFISIPKSASDKTIEQLPKNTRTLIGIFSRANIRGQLGLDDIKEEEVYLVIGNAP